MILLALALVILGVLLATILGVDPVDTPEGGTYHPPGNMWDKIGMGMSIAGTLLGICVLGKMAWLEVASWLG